MTTIPAPSLMIRKRIAELCRSFVYRKLRMAVTAIEVTNPDGTSEMLSIEEWKYRVWNN